LGATPYLLLDARYERVREGGRLVDCAVLVAVGIEAGGKRRVLGVSVALSEAEVHWRDFLDRLVKRGVHGVRLIVADDHAGLKAARRAVFPSVPWQRAASSICNTTPRPTYRGWSSARRWHASCSRSSTPRIAPRRSGCWPRQ
jgi:transposase-like protein